MTTMDDQQVHNELTGARHVKLLLFITYYIYLLLFTFISFLFTSSSFFFKKHFSYCPTLTYDSGLEQSPVIWSHHITLKSKV